MREAELALVFPLDSLPSNLTRTDWTKNSPPNGSLSTPFSYPLGLLQLLNHSSQLWVQYSRRFSGSRSPGINSNWGHAWGGSDFEGPIGTSTLQYLVKSWNRTLLRSPPTHPSAKSGNLWSQDGGWWQGNMGLKRFSRQFQYTCLTSPTDNHWSVV